MDWADAIWAGVYRYGAGVGQIWDPHPLGLKFVGAIDIPVATGYETNFSIYIYL